MRFGELFARLLHGCKWSKIDYELLKNSTTNPNFLQIILKEIVLVNLCFVTKREEVSKSRHKHDALFLRKWQILNYLAVLKACKKRDKANPKTPLRDIVTQALLQQDFVKDFSKPPLFEETTSESCTICQCPIESPFALKCNHKFCYVCLKDCFLNGIDKCPLCRNEQSLNPVNQGIDLVLGVVATKYYPSGLQPSVSIPGKNQPPSAPKPCVTAKGKASSKPRKLKYRIKDQERRKRISSSLDKLAKLSMVEVTDRANIITKAAERIKTLRAEKEQLTSYLVSYRTIFRTINNLGVPSLIISCAGVVIRANPAMLEFSDLPAEQVVGRSMSVLRSQFRTMQNVPITFHQVLVAMRNACGRTLRFIHVITTRDGLAKQHVVCMSSFIEPLVKQSLLFVAGRPTRTRQPTITLRKTPVMPLNMVALENPMSAVS